MLFVFGLKGYQTLLARLHRPCPACGQLSPHSLVAAGSRVSVFFIPLFSVSRRYELQCLSCGQLTRVSRAEADALTAGLPSA